MMAEKKGLGCAAPTGSVVGEQESGTDERQTDNLKEVETMVTVKIGQKAPDFNAPAFINGDFSQVKLSDYLGKWVLLCFYPGDFTFV